MNKIRTMIKSNTKIKEQTKRKTNPLLVETITLARKNPKWIEVAGILSGPRKQRRDVNLKEIENIKSESIVVCGKVLSEGEISKKKKISALSFSEKAKEKLLKAGCEVNTIAEEITKNKEAKGVEIFK